MGIPIDQEQMYPFVLCPYGSILEQRKRLCNRAHPICGDCPGKMPVDETESRFLRDLHERGEYKAEGLGLPVHVGNIQTGEVLRYSSAWMNRQLACVDAYMVSRDILRTDVVARKRLLATIVIDASCGKIQLEEWVALSGKNFHAEFKKYIKYPPVLQLTFEDMLVLL